jgi:hypothetical protein
MALPVRASVSIYLSPEDLSLQADLVVEATVLRRASGFDPVEQTLATYVTLQVERTHRGPDGLTRLVVREPGGRHGDLVHEVDAVPTYRPGERVLAFLEPTPDGALRTAGMFFGKFTLDSPRTGPVSATRDLGGQGRILRGPPQPVERFDLADLASTVATVRPAGAGTTERHFGRRASDGVEPPAAAPVEATDWRAYPAEYGRLLWEQVVEKPGATLTAGGETGQDRDLAAGDRDDAGNAPRFVVGDPDYPTRWEASDTGGAVTFNIQRSGNPLGSGVAAVEQMRRAMAAWTEVPESRLVVEAGNTFFNYTGTVGASPRSHYSGTNVILFGDPYAEIPDPVNCAGVLAVGGYWRSASISPESVNNTQFYAAMQAYVIFNNGFECYLGDSENLAEVATHEIGHGLGFGHSVEDDAIMRETPYGNRGPRLGDDDRDAAHCHYPHRLTLIAPNGGEAWDADSLQQIVWQQTAEAGPDPGVVDIEYSSDAGATWSTVAEGTPNVGSLTWVVPRTPGTQTRVRVVRHARGAGTGPTYPEHCSGDASDAPFSILGEAPQAGVVPDGSDGEPLRVEPAGAGVLRLEWSPSCAPGADGYAVYEGSLDQLRAGIWDHQPVDCASGGLVNLVSPAPGSRYFLIAPLEGEIEGDFGETSAGVLRPESASACGTRQAGRGCDSM